MLKSILPGIVEFVIRLRFRVWVGFEVESLPECPAPRDPRGSIFEVEWDDSHVIAIDRGIHIEQSNHDSISYELRSSTSEITRIKMQAIS